MIYKVNSTIFSDSIRSYQCRTQLSKYKEYINLNTTVIPGIFSPYSNMAFRTFMNSIIYILDFNNPSNYLCKEFFTYVIIS